MTNESTTGPMTCGVASAPAHGEAHASGDRAVVAELADGALLAAVDALGHGPDAQTAAAAAADALMAHAGSQPDELLRRCQEALRRTRGAAISVATVRFSGRLEWLAVGNVQGAVTRSASGTTTRLVTRGGVVGLRLPALHVTVSHLQDGDTIVLFTDGIAEAMTRELPVADHPAAAAQRLLDGYQLVRDDSLVLVGRFRGGQRP